MLAYFLSGFRHILCWIPVSQLLGCIVDQCHTESIVWVNKQLCLHVSTFYFWPYYQLLLNHGFLWRLGICCSKNLGPLFGHLCYDWGIGIFALWQDYGVKCIFRASKQVALCCKREFLSDISVSIQVVNYIFIFLNTAFN